MENNFEVSPSLFVKKLATPDFRFKTPENIRKRLQNRIKLDTSVSRDIYSRKYDYCFHTEPDELINKSYQKDFSIEKPINLCLPLSHKSRNIPKVDLIFSFKSKVIPRIIKKPQKSPRQALESSQGPRFRLPSRETSYDHNLYQSFFQSPNKIVETLQSSQQYSKGMQKTFQQRTMVLSYPKKM